MERIRRGELFGLPLSWAGSEEEVMAEVAGALTGSRPGLTVSFVNPYSWRLASLVADYAPLLRQCDIVLPDGIGVVKAMRWVHGAEVARLSFDASSLYLPVFRLLNAGKRSVFVIGAKPGVAERAMSRMRAEFTDIDYRGCLDGYCEPNEAIARILEAAPDMVLCGMGAPYQERLAIELRRAGYSGVTFTCGGFLDQLAQNARYYPAWVDRLELRWLWRIRKEPRRLVKRYAIDYMPFMVMTFREMARQRWSGIAGRAGRRTG
jgi:N-acetylglucosaminyldiphosphoundecaprenol N-acetyl-beta-D-mannosaminyltransferase